MDVIELPAGATLKAGRAAFTVRDASGVVDLTGCDLKWKRRFRQAAAGIAEESTTLEVWGEEADGQVTPTYTAAQSALLAPGEHKCEIEVTKPIDPENPLAPREVIKITNITLRVLEGLADPPEPEVP